MLDALVVSLDGIVGPCPPDRMAVYAKCAERGHQVTSRGRWGGASAGWCQHDHLPVLLCRAKPGPEGLDSPLSIAQMPAACGAPLPRRMAPIMPVSCRAILGLSDLGVKSALRRRANRPSVAKTPKWRTQNFPDPSRPAAPSVLLAVPVYLMLALAAQIALRPAL